MQTSVLAKHNTHDTGEGVSPRVISPNGEWCMDDYVWPTWKILLF